MCAIDPENFLISMYSNCRVSVAEARELSWRKFYHIVGGKEKLSQIGNKEQIKKFLKNSETCFQNILDNKLTDEELQDLINLPSTTVWVEDGNPEIKVKEITDDV